MRDAPKYMAEENSIVCVVQVAGVFVFAKEGVFVCDTIISEILSYLCPRIVLLKVMSRFFPCAKINSFSRGDNVASCIQSKRW